ncbi:MAG TPA: hypothetical protein VFN38_02670, partial [Gemmatimonadaceae bacterium]|nr:hypothetical protein [Gemmatimonadaceae bacterium]
MPTAVCRRIAFAALFASAPATALAQPSLQPPTRIATVRLGTSRDALEGSISPDGRSFVFEQADGEQRRLWLLDLPSGTTRLLTPRAGSRHNAAWSSDGRQLAYAADLKLPGYADALQGIWVLDLADGRERLVHGTSRYDMVWEVSWTPDGRIVFVDWAGGQGGTVPVQSVDPRTGAVADVTSDTVRVESPQVSPDGRSLAFLGTPCVDSNRRGLRVLTLGARNDSTSRCLTDVAARTGAPLWSPDGRT